MNKTTPAQIISTTLPAGKYIVGDPCYSMGDHENWISWLERADYRNQKTILEAKTPNGIAAGVSTMHGDGVYRGIDGNLYGVDAGLIGVVPLLDARDLNEVIGGKLGYVKEFDHDFAMSRDEDGVIHIGDLQIPTGGYEDDLDAYFSEENY